LQPVKKKVPCPRCGTLKPFTPDNKWRPFCSERCKMIDLGAWASESYRVPDAAAPDDAGEPQDTQDDPTQS
jgi:endogenous inhibitor of DNA gyrase (YacG/DUF329 family)